MTVREVNLDTMNGSGVDAGVIKPLRLEEKTFTSLFYNVRINRFVTTQLSHYYHNFASPHTQTLPHNVHRPSINMHLRQNPINQEFTLAVIS